MIISDFLEKNAKVYPERIAIVDQVKDVRLTFRQVQERVYRLANALSGLGVAKGDRVAVIQDNCFEWLEIYLAIGKIGAVATPLNYRLIGKELADLLNHSGSETLIAGSDFVPVIEPFTDRLAALKHTIVMGKPLEGTLNYDTLLAEAPAGRPQEIIARDDLFCLLYTGGTTGRPKGAMLSHHNLTAVCTTWIIEWGLSHDEVGMIVTPLFHTGSNWPLFAGFMMGNTQVILKGVDFATMFATIQQERVTYSLWLSAIVGLIINDERFHQYDLSSLNLVMTGGGPLGEAQLRKLIDVLGCRVSHGGGQTETGPICHIRLEDHLDGPGRRLGSAGQEVFNMELKVVDADDRPVPPGGVGELCARGDALMKGYWKMPAETRESMKDGWQHTGDLVRIDEDGFIYYVDRLKDMIKSGGENVFSKEVEDVIYALPPVAEVAVIGVPDDTWGEAVKALVIVKPGMTLTQEEVISHCRKSLSGFKCPKSVEFGGQFPKTGLGKIAKNLLREKYWEGLERRIH
ncbi:MAG: long-chain-fatty-acid--CoA ligase [Desulfobacterales bacterium]|nr:long-chain-fatty-acid--CoA ligase [Desulfobacterales bacterium]